MSGGEAFRPLLDFWFGQAGFWYGRHPFFDRECGFRFGALLEDAAAHSGWQETPFGALAYILLLDQMPRNIYRGLPRAFAFDAHALAAARGAIARRHDQQVPLQLRSWLYMPFMHAEDKHAQAEGVRAFSALENKEGLRFMHMHAELISRFGRFPHRNALLGRRSTPEETRWLAEKGDAFNTEAGDDFIQLAGGAKLAVEVETPKALAEDPPALPVLLMRGLGTQLTMWPFAFITGLLASGRQVILYDHRDAGASQKYAGGGPYMLGDMAEDARALLRALAIERAHIIGISMGGMIAALTASQSGEQVSPAASLTAIMTTTNAPDLPQADDETRAVVFAPPSSSAPEDVLAQVMKAARHIASPGYEQDWGKIRRIQQAALVRAGAGREEGIARQMQAIWHEGDLTPLCRTIACPALVIHGKADRLIPPAGGAAMARAIKGAALHLIDGLGHDMPESAIADLLPRILPFLAQAEKNADKGGLS